MNHPTKPLARAMLVPDVVPPELALSRGPR